jgi:hypothetical protein
MTFFRFFFRHCLPGPVLKNFLTAVMLISDNNLDLLSMFYLIKRNIIYLNQGSLSFKTACASASLHF